MGTFVWHPCTHKDESVELLDSAMGADEGVAALLAPSIWCAGMVNLVAVMERVQSVRQRMHLQTHSSNCSRAWVLFHTRKWCSHRVGTSPLCLPRAAQ